MVIWSSLKFPKWQKRDRKWDYTKVTNSYLIGPLTLLVPSLISSCLQFRQKKKADLLDIMYHRLRESFINLRVTVTVLNSGCQSWWHCYSCSFPRHALVSLIFCLQSWSLPGRRASPSSTSKLVGLYALWHHCPLTEKRRERKRQLTRRKERSRLCSMLVISKLPMTTSQFS